jgi:hypothetical protein
MDFFTGLLVSLAANAGNVVLFIGTAAFLEPTEENGDFLAGVQQHRHKFCWLFQQSVLLHQKPWKFVGRHWIDSFDNRNIMKESQGREVVEDAAAA